MQTPVQKTKNHAIKNYCRFLVVLSVFLATPIFANSYLVLLKKDAPSPESIVGISESPTFQNQWPLSSFTTLKPDSVEYLFKNRPQENLQRSIEEYPDGNTAKIYRYLKIELADDLDEKHVVDLLLEDVQIEFASVDEFIVIPLYLNKNKNTLNTTSDDKAFDANFLVDLNIISTWELSEGMGYIGALDTGLQVDHSDLESFNSSGIYTGGNLLDGSGVFGMSYQEDTGDNDLNVDEKQLFYTGGNPHLLNCDLADGAPADNYYKPYIAGHGTHVTGIMVGKNHNIGGICKNCGMSMMKFSTQFINNTFPAFSCFQYNGNYIMGVRIFESAIAGAYENLINMGMGTVNYSGGYKEDGSSSIDCDRKPLGSVCIQQTRLLSRNIMLVAAAGNDKLLQPAYPARDEGVVAVGGLDESGNFWEELVCPGSGTKECGSNSSNLALGHKIDVVTQARNVNSTFYTGAVHSIVSNCTDINDGINDGYGFCTGTSMSTPQVSGIVQLMRSAHPLLPNGTYDPTQQIGLINILNATAYRGVSGLNNDDKLGYGLPDARLALETILGKSNDEQMKTRLTPMFDLYSSAVNNNVYTPFSQVAVSFLSTTYIPNTSADLVNEFTDFWYDQETESYSAPRAGFYVFTTNNNPFSNIKDMVPLRRMEKTTFDINDNVIGRNDTYVVSVSEIEDYHDELPFNSGDEYYDYNFAGIEGYILPPCTPEPSCMPEKSTRLYRDESDSMNHKLIPTNNTPTFSPATLLGYVYLNQDTDQDGLIDGQEIILGTNYSDPVDDVDTDGDGLTDSEEYPPAGVPVSDPLINPNKLEWLPAVVGYVLG